MFISVPVLNNAAPYRGSMMDYDRFVHLVTQRLDLPADSEGAHTTRSVLQTLAERLPTGETTDLASSLPREIDRYMIEADSGQEFSLREFVDRIKDRSDVEEEDAVLQANIVLFTVSEVVRPQELRNARTHLPDEFDLLFQIVDRQRASSSSE